MVRGVWSGRRTTEVHDAMEHDDRLRQYILVENQRRNMRTFFVRY